MPKIIGLLRVRNEEFLIKDTLDHLALFCSGGVFVYDDCSTDNTVKLCEKHSIVKKIILGTNWDSIRERAEFENRATLLKTAKEFASEEDWFVYVDADERIEFDWNEISKFPKEVIGIKMKLYDFYITEEDVNKNYSERKWLGPECRSILMAFRNLPTLSFYRPDQREVELGTIGKIIENGYVKHYGKALTVELWERKCDYYISSFPMYSEKWKKRKGKAVHKQYSDFGNKLIYWEERESKGVDLLSITNPIIPEEKLSILITNHHLLDFTGSEIYTLTLADYLKRNGHNVIVYSKFIDLLRPAFEKLDIGLITDLEEIKNDHFDIAHIHHNTSSFEVRYYFPTLPMVFLSHGVIPFLEQPPVIDLNISKYFAVSEEVRNNLLTKIENEEKVLISRNIVDKNKFYERKPINNKLKYALVLSNKIDDETESIIRHACNELHVECDFIGMKYKEISQDDIPEYINKADVVFSLGRGVVEAMMCKRIPFVFDAQGGDGFVTPDNYENLMSRNFSGRTFYKKFNMQELVEELKKYNASNANDLFNLTMKYFSPDEIVESIVKTYREAIISHNDSPNETNIEFVNSVNNMLYQTRIYTERKTQRNVSHSQSNSLSNQISNSNIKEESECGNKSRVKNEKPNINALLEISQIHINHQNYFDASLLLQKILRDEPENQKAKINYRLLNEKIFVTGKDKKWSTKRSRDILLQAEKLIEEQRFVEAKNKLFEILNMEPEHVEALNDLAVLEIMDGKYETGIELLEELLKIDTDNQSALENIQFAREQINQK